MTTLSEIRTRVRQDLRDTDSGAYRWSDSQLDRHIGHALDEVALAIPREQSATIATTPGSRDISLSSLAGLIEVEAVEHPAGEFPPAYVGFSSWAGTLTVHTEVAPTGANARIWYTSRHTLDGSSCTLPAQFEDILVMGAAAYAALEYATFAADRLNTGGDEVVEQFSANARARLTAFHQLLRTHSRRNRVRARRAYTPA